MLNIGWTVEQNTWEPERERFFESLFSLGNGYMGLRGTPGWGQWSVNAYQTRFHDLSGFNPAASSPASPWGMPDTVQRARMDNVYFAKRFTEARSIFS